MASSWNKGTLVGQTDQPVKTNVIREKQPSQEGGKSFLETVLDEAASALATGGSYVADVAESAYDLLPESEDIVEDIKTTAQAITEGTQAVAKSTSQKVQQGWNLGTSTPAKLLIKDIIKNNPYVLGNVPASIAISSATNKQVTEENFTEEEVDYLRELAKKYGTGLLKKEMYDDKELRVGGVRGKEGALPTDLTVAESLYNSLGDTTIKKDPETGEYYVEDVYDWNIYTDYTVGGTDPKTGLPKGKVYTTEEFESQLNPMEEVLKTINSDASLFQIVHNLAFIFGSRDYKDEARNTGSKIRIKLGKLD
jgi:hypothetical protein